MKRRIRVVCAVASKLRKTLNNGCAWHIIAVALVVTLLPAALLADCPSGTSCEVGIQGAEYSVTGPCQYSQLYANPSLCSAKLEYICVDGACPNAYNPPPPPPPPPLCVSGGAPCVTPDRIVQDPKGQAALQPLELEARQHIAALRGVPDDKLNVYWSRGEIRAYMYLRILQMVDSPTFSEEDGAVVDFYTATINQDRKDAANKALALYSTWLSSPCTFQVPVGDPKSYLEEPATVAACLPSNNPACLLGECIPPAPSASQFTNWAVGSLLQEEINTWGTSLVEGPYIGLSTTDAGPAAAFEYDSSFAGVAEGMAYLTAKHAQIANLPAVEEAAVESDLQEQWLEALHDFAGEQFRETALDVMSGVFKGGLAGGSEGTLADTFGVETIFSDSVADVAEDLGGEVAETWETFVGPALAAAAVIATESWQVIDSTEVPVQLQAAIDDAKHEKTVSEYAQSAEGRNLILESLIKSTLPDFIVARLGDNTVGTAPSAGPLTPTDPRFTQGNSVTPLGSFVYTDWVGTVSRGSVGNGWFVSAADSTSDGLRYSPSLPYLTPKSQGNVEQWRAWLDGTNFLAQRESVRVGDAHVEEAFNSCPTLLVGTGTPVKLGMVCVAFKPGGDGSFSIKKDDKIVIDGQIRTAAGDQFQAADGTYYVQTTEPFGDPAPPDGVLAVFVHPDGDCFSSSLLGTRVAGPDCTYGPTISTDRGIVTIASLLTPKVSVTGGTFVFNGNQEAGTGFAYGAAGTSDVLSPAVTFSYGGVGTTNYDVTATAPKDVGSYLVKASFAGNASYKSAFATAALIITKAPATISFNVGTLNQVYDGNVKTVATTTNPAGLSNVQLSFTGTPLNAGSYPVTATLNNVDYQGGSSGTLVIGKAKPTVTFTGAPANAAKGSKFVVSASTNSTTTPKITATGACTIAANVVAMLSNIGTCQLSAAWTTDTNYLAASATQQTVTPGSQVNSLITTVNSFGLRPIGATVSFTWQLQLVWIDLQVPGDRRACPDLSIFNSHVKAQTGKELSATQARQMLAGAAQIGATLGCH
jgi:hypothetical protein